MTEKELSKYYWIKKEIKEIEEKLEELGFGLGSPIMNDMPKVHDNTSPVEKLAERRMQLIEIYIEKRISALEEHIKIERFIETIDDPEMRLIIRYRHLDLMKWEQIAERVYMDRTTVARKYRRYLNDAHKSREL